MKKDKLKLSDTETEIMMYIWKQPDKILARDLMNTFNSEKNKKWKIQTVNTYLTRLVENGILCVERCGRAYLYFPTMTIEEYKLTKVCQLINHLYDSTLDFIKSAIDLGLIDKSDITFR